MTILGSGVLKGMLITLRHFFETFIADLNQFPGRYRADAPAVRQMPSEKGIFTVQYPEEKLQLPERFRYLPMLIREAETGELRCTACGICSRVCPPQCIWIVRAKRGDGKPRPHPAEFHIDTSMCMSCGFCAEYCPFDAIKMNHEYELASYERHKGWVYDRDALSVSTEYYARTHPLAWAEEEEARRRKEEAEKAKVERE
ncbi:MAG: NuoI/complex I 23 kDa subunit family protein [Anaerolineae bacterium]